MGENRFSIWIGTSSRRLDFVQREEFVKRKLIADGFAGLFEKLCEIKSQQLGGVYQLCSILAVGGQGILYMAEALQHDNQLVVVKFPFLPYHKPAYISLNAISEARTAIWWEAHVLSMFPGSILPEFFDIIEDTNLLHDPAWGDLVRNHEPYLVQELIQGQTLEEVIGFTHRSHPIHSRSLETMAWSIALQVLNICGALWKDKKLVYTDLRPQNIMIAEGNEGRGLAGWHRRSRPAGWPIPPVKTDTSIRLVDVGSIVNHRNYRYIPCHPSYVPPGFNLTEDPSLRSELNHHFVLYTLGKTLFQLLTNLEPLPKRDPDLKNALLREYSGELIETISAMICNEYQSFDDALSSVHTGIESLNIATI